MRSATITVTMLGLALLGLGLGACAPQSVPLVLRFPSTETFLVTQSLRIRVFDDELGCASLVNAVTNGTDLTGSVADVGGLTPCAVRSGVSVPDVGPGQHAFLVEGLDAMGNVTILAGCARHEVFAGAQIEVDLYPTTNYDAEYHRAPPDNVPLDQYCGGGGL
ncbi:MAG: hypothetical protein K1X94_03525 [Sandaracinaceae bacterium]|nr:hypothetical protein [Sandaracinaceae bacterium]